ncbi:hypothetical protein PINS_up008436 [Pythium insidiosum]|nr:hypothetical protein PINS_up008436 [Pythium insidiosum]
MADNNGSNGSSSSVLLSNNFQFDGTTSDLAQQFYRRHLAGAKVDPLWVTPPAAITRPLNALGLSFDELPGLLQRAVVWDAGFVFTTRGDLMAVRTLDGRGMDEIAVTRDVYEAQGCTTQVCQDPDQGNAKWYKSDQCNSVQMSRAALCAMDIVPYDEEAKMSMWSTGGNPKSIPQLIAYHHHWTDQLTNKSYAMHVIHTRSKANSPPYRECSLDSQRSTNGIGSIVIPCTPTEMLNETMNDRFKVPKPGKIVAAWLKEFKKRNSTLSTSTDSPSRSRGTGDEGSTTLSPDTKSSDNTTLVITVTIAGAVLVLAALLAAFVLRRRRHSHRGASEETDRYGYKRDAETPRHCSHEAALMDDAIILSTPRHCSHEAALMDDAIILSTPRHCSHEAALMDDAIILSNLLPMYALEFGQCVRRNDFEDVIYGRFDDQKVEIKRLLPQHREDVRRVDMLLAEAKMMMGLKHEHIVSLVGVSWTSLIDVCVVFEFMAGGDLYSALIEFARQQRPVGFDADKLKIATHIALALTYLHSLDDIVLHRDLKSRNVLLTENFDAKLAGFGCSRKAVDDMMTSGIGSLLWMAPEVMMGGRYNESVDVYSFGVMLSELDTQAKPFSHVVDPGCNMNMAQVVQDVTTGRLQVQFTRAADPEIVALARSCMAMIPSSRPTAAMVLAQVRRVWRRLQDD